MRSTRSAFTFGRIVEEKDSRRSLEAQPRYQLGVPSPTTKRSSAPTKRASPPTKRYTDGGAIPSPVDLEIAQGLLHSSTRTVPSDRSLQTLNQQPTDLDLRRSVHFKDRHSSYASQPSALSNSHEPPSRLTSTTWSTVSNRDNTGPSMASSSRSSSVKLKFNKLAHSDDLPEPSQPQAEAGSRSRDARIHSEGSLMSKLPSKTWLIRKLIRKTPSSRPINSTSNGFLPRKSSSMDIARPSSEIIQGLSTKSLEDIARLGGISLLSLPSDFSPCALAVPTCLAATGNYIALHCECLPV